MVLYILIFIFLGRRREDRLHRTISSITRNTLFLISSWMHFDLSHKHSLEWFCGKTCDNCWRSDHIVGGVSEASYCWQLRQTLLRKFIVFLSMVALIPFLSVYLSSSRSTICYSVYAEFLLDDVIVFQLFENFSALLWNPKFHYRVQKILYCSLFWASWIQSAPSNVFL
jgi:hypothetical protein